MAVLRGAAANKEGELCVQAIFLLLDVLKKWAEDAKGTAAFSASGTLVVDTSLSSLGFATEVQCAMLHLLCRCFMAWNLFIYCFSVLSFICSFICFPT